MLIQVEIAKEEYFGYIYANGNYNTPCNSVTSY